MRGDGVGVGDLGAVPGGAWWSGYPTGGDDGRGARGQHVGGILSGGGGDERDAARERGRDGVGIGDGARVEPGAGGDDGDGAVGADGMRGDGVGVGDVGAVPGGAGRRGDSAGGDDD